MTPDDWLAVMPSHITLLLLYPGTTAYWKPLFLCIESIPWPRVKDNRPNMGQLEMTIRMELTVGILAHGPISLLSSTLLPGELQE